MMAMTLTASGALSAAPPAWSVVVSDFQHNASITCVVYVDDVLKEDTANILGAFVNDTVRGVATPIAVGDDYMFFLTVYSNRTSGDTLSFRFYDAALDTILSITEKISFAPDAQIGDPVTPFQFHGFIPPLIQTITHRFEAGWNMVSIPLDVLNYSKTNLFPGALSDAFAFQNGYQAKTMLELGTGYWLKFSSDSAQRVVAFSGTEKVSDTLSVAAGWNIVGTVSAPVASTSILAQGTTIESQYFKFSSGYAAADTLVPGSGYWVKVSSDGSLILNASVSSTKTMYPQSIRDMRR